MKKKIRIIFLFLISKLLEIAPLLSEKIIYFIFLEPLFYILKHLKTSRYDQEIYAYVSSNYVREISYYCLFLFPLFVFLTPFFIGHLTKKRRLIRIYWLLSSLLDFIFIFGLGGKWPESLESIFAWGLGVMLTFFGFILRSIGAFLACLILRRKEAQNKVSPNPFSI